MRRRGWIAAAAALLLVVLAGALLLNRTPPFRPDRWEAADRVERQGMARSFVREYGETPLTRDEVIELLGEEPDYGGFSIRHKTEENLVYDFGAAKGRIFDPPGNLCLVISFGEDGRAEGMEVLYYQW